MSERPGQLLSWSDAYLIGVEELDYEHKDLFDHLNMLQLELAADTNTENIQRILEEIYVRFVAHFALEETYMHEHKYPKAVEHKREHENLLESMRDIIGKFSDATDVDELDRLFARLRKWVMNHVVYSDRDLAVVDA